MRRRNRSLLLVGLIICFGACQPQSDYCTVMGTIKGVKDGTKLVLHDQFNSLKVFASTRVKNGAYEFHPDISAPTHVYLYTKAGKQLKDFFLEPGTVVANVDATDDMDWTVPATGTPSNDSYFKIQQYFHNGEINEAQALMDEVFNAEQTGILALYYADVSGCPAHQGLRILDHLSPDLAANPHIAELRETLTLRTAVEPAPEGSGAAHYYIDMEYADPNGNPVRLSSVINNPSNRCVILDFWATWCGPCRKAIPGLLELYTKYHEKGLEIYSVSEDPNEEKWKNFLKETQLPWIQVLDDKAGKQSQAQKDYVFNAIPLVILIDGETGEILLRDHTSELENILSSLLE